MAIVEPSFAVLQKPSPLIEDFNRISTVKIEEVLTKLQITAEKSILSYFCQRRKETQYHASEQNVQKEMADLEFYMSAYLYIRISEDIDTRYQYWFLSSPLRIGPTFASLAQTRFHRMLALLIDRTEAQIVRSAALRFSLDSTGDVIDSRKLEEYLAWLAVVRLSIIAHVVESLSYTRMWKELDGDAGWLLSLRIEQVASHILETAVYKQFREEIYGRDTFLMGLGLKSVLNSITKLNQISINAAIWRNWCLLNGCIVDKIGVEHPFEFSPMNPDLYTPPDSSPVILPYMYARKAAEERIIRLRNSWNVIRTQMLNENRIPNENWLQFALTAGTLRHGGAHPPHKTHRNGCMFDLDLTYLPALERGQASRDEGTLQSVDPIPHEVEADDSEPEDGQTAASDPNMELPTCKSYKVPKRQQVVDPLFGVKKEEETICQQQLWETAIIKFTQCIMLTFPTFIIFASETYVERARKGLSDKIKELQEEYTKIRDETLVEELNVLHELVSPRQSGHRGAKTGIGYQSKSDHNDHWHVNYDPDGLGDEKAYVNVKSQNPKLHEKIENAFLTLGKENILERLLDA